MDAMTAMKRKRDTRSYQDRVVPDNVLQRVLDAARMAGSAKNVQPVRLIVVSEQATKSALIAGGDYAGWIDQAPHLVVITVQTAAGPRRLFDVGRHAQNLMIAATAEGLASCPVTFHHQEVVREVLSIPEEVEAPMVVSVGWPTTDAPGSPIAGPRIPLDEYVMNESWLP